MKILVIQLARFGDILQTWPTLRALRRTYPESEIHVLARARFRAAFDGLDAVDRFWNLDTKGILAPLVQRRPEIDQSLAQIEQWLNELQAQSFDKVINLSFSPVSSFVTEMVSGLTTEIVGYSRHRDGYLSIPDDPSAFFYAQVGNDRANRVHLTDLFAHIAGVDLQASDWAGPEAVLKPEWTVRPGSILVHVGASQSHKTLGWMKWAQIVKGLSASKIGDVILIGAAAEREIADKIVAACPDLEPINWVGRTEFGDLFAILKHAQLLIGGDSGPVHVASLTGTPVFNISFPTVSLWETGPRTAHSRVICVEEEAALPSDVCVSDIILVWHEIAAARAGLAFLEARTMIPSLVVRDRVKGFELSGTSRDEDFAYHKTGFQWQLIRAIYMGELFPPAPTAIFVEGVRRLVEVNQVALEQIQTLKRQPENSSCSLILDRVDEIIEQIAQMVPDVGPLVRWFQTERSRLGPQSAAEILAITGSLHQRFDDVLSLYHFETSDAEQDVQLND